MSQPSKPSRASFLGRRKGTAQSARKFKSERAVKPHVCQYGYTGHYTGYNRRLHVVAQCGRRGCWRFNCYTFVTIDEARKLNRKLPSVSLHHD